MVIDTASGTIGRSGCTRGLLSTDVVKEKLGEIKDLAGLDKDALAAVVKEYYDLSVATFSERFDVEHQIKKNDMEIHALEMEVNDMHGKFIIPKLKKVHNFKLMGGEE
jgi:hypothetical protein